MRYTLPVMVLVTVETVGSSATTVDVWAREPRMNALNGSTRECLVWSLYRDLICIFMFTVLNKTDQEGDAPVACTILRTVVWIL